MSLKHWRMLAILALTGCFGLTFAVVWVALAYGSNLRKITEGAQVCLAGSRAYDSIAAAQMIGRLDLVSFLLTAGGLLLAIFALLGFWTIRREAVDEASKVAAEEARRVAQFYYSLDMNERGTYMNVKGGGIQASPYATHDELGRSRSVDRPASSFDLDTVSILGAKEEGTGAAHVKPARRARRAASEPKRNTGSDGSDS